MTSSPSPGDQKLVSWSSPRKRTSSPPRPLTWSLPAPPRRSSTPAAPLIRSLSGPPSRTRRVIPSRLPLASRSSGPARPLITVSSAIASYAWPSWLTRTRPSTGLTVMSSWVAVPLVITWSWPPPPSTRVAEDRADRRLDVHPVGTEIGVDDEAIEHRVGAPDPYGGAGSADHRSSVGLLHGDVVRAGRAGYLDDVGRCVTQPGSGLLQVHVDLYGRRPGQIVDDHLVRPGARPRQQLLRAGGIDVINVARVGGSSTGIRWPGSRDDHCRSCRRR